MSIYNLENCDPSSCPEATMMKAIPQWRLPTIDDFSVSVDSHIPK